MKVHAYPREAYTEPGFCVFCRQGIYLLPKPLMEISGMGKAWCGICPVTAVSPAVYDCYTGNPL